MASNTLHIVPHDESWAVKREGNERASSTHETQKEAIDAARNMAKNGDNLVIHRPDGTIRETTTFTESANGTTSSSNGGNGRRNELRPEDVMSVGTRVSWASILAGGVVAMAVYAALGMLAVAIGISTVDQLSGRTFVVSAALISVFICLVSLYLGGYVTSLLTAGENKTEAILYGLLLWGALFVLALFTGTGLGFGYGTLTNSQNTPPAQSAAETSAKQRFEQAGEKAGVSAEKSQAMYDAYSQAGQYTDDVSATTAAWIGFGGMVLSILAAIAGAVMGAGPQLVIKQLRDRRVVVKPAT